MAFACFFWKSTLTISWQISDSHSDSLQNCDKSNITSNLNFLAVSKPSELPTYAISLCITEMQKRSKNYNVFVCFGQILNLEQIELQPNFMVVSNLVSSLPRHHKSSIVTQYTSDMESKKQVLRHSQSINQFGFKIEAKNKMFRTSTMEISCLFIYLFISESYNDNTMYC